MNPTNTNFPEKECTEKHWYRIDENYIKNQLRIKQLEKEHENAILWKGETLT